MLRRKADTSDYISLPVTVLQILTLKYSLQGSNIAFEIRHSVWGKWKDGERERVCHEVHNLYVSLCQVLGSYQREPDKRGEVTSMCGGRSPPCVCGGGGGHLHVWGGEGYLHVCGGKVTSMCDTLLGLPDMGLILGLASAIDGFRLLL